MDTESPNLEDCQSRADACALEFAATNICALTFRDAIFNVKGCQMAPSNPNQPAVFSRNFRLFGTAAILLISPTPLGLAAAAALTLGLVEKE